MGIRPIAESRIVNTLKKLKSPGLSESTLRRVSYELSRLAKHCDLNNADEVKNYIANIKGANSYKDVFAKTYNYYIKLNNLTWKRPKCKSERKLPRIPTKETIMKMQEAVLTLPSEKGTV